jgi:hypothetical protein
MISAIHLFIPVGGSDHVRIGKYRVTADFPCRPKRHKAVITKTETGDELSQTSLLCTQGGVIYSLSPVEIPEQALKSLSADAWVSNTLDGLRAQPHNAHKSSSRLSHQGFPAIRMHFSDSSESPSMDMARLSVLTDAGTIMIGTSWHSDSPEPQDTVTGSLTIAAPKD